MSASTAKGARRVLINFSSGPIHCRAGECRSCVTPATAEAGHADEAETATAVEQPLSPTKAAPTPNAVPRRRPRHRFDYRPPTENLCFSCGRPINPLTGECRCSD